MVGTMLNLMVKLWWKNNFFGSEIVINVKTFFIMRSKLFKTLLTILAPIVIDYIVKKFTQKKQVQESKQVTQS